MATMQQIGDWLKKLGMSEYAERFAKNDIEIDNLTEFDDHDLERLGVSCSFKPTPRWPRTTDPVVRAARGSERS
jgi:SAM domain (Sterile alpha motif)